MGHIFPYSPRRGTPAARMPQVPPPVVKARAHRLREASARRRAAWLQSLVGTRQKVLAERGGSGHAENFAPVRLPRGAETGGGAANRGDIVELVITGVEGGMLIGAAV